VEHGQIRATAWPKGSARSTGLISGNMPDCVGGTARSRNKTTGGIEAAKPENLGIEFASGAAATAA
jgi:hypothetical protein